MMRCRKLLNAAPIRGPSADRRRACAIVKTSARKARRKSPSVRAGESPKRIPGKAYSLLEWALANSEKFSKLLAANPDILSITTGNTTVHQKTPTKRRRGRPAIDIVTSTQNALALVAGVILSERDGKKTHEAFQQVVEAKLVSNSRVQHALYQFWRNDPDLRQKWLKQNDLDIRALIESLRDENGGPDDAALIGLETLFYKPRAK